MYTFTESLENDAIYMSCDMAVEELKRRYNDPILKQKVIDWIGLEAISKIPFIFHSPIAVLFRDVATPNFETARFMQMAQDIHLRPIIFEYLDDTFVSNNPLKQALGKVHVFYGTGKKGGRKIKPHTIIDINDANGKNIRDVQTVFNTSLADFHHQLFFKKYPHAQDTLFDASAPLEILGDRAHLYYKKYLALFICFGCLFEVFLPNDPKERAFFDNIYYPAFQEIVAMFGVKPMIIRLLPEDSADDDYWNWYAPEDFSLGN